MQIVFLVLEISKEIYNYWKGTGLSTVNDFVLPLEIYLNFLTLIDPSITPGPLRVKAGARLEWFHQWSH